MQPEDIQRIFYGSTDQARFTQDFPILPDVWIRYGGAPWIRHEVLLTPHYQSSAPRLALSLRERFAAEKKEGTEQARAWHEVHDNFDSPQRILINESVVLARLSFYELVRIALPLSSWWEQNVTKLLKERDWESVLAHPDSSSGDLRWLSRFVPVVGGIWHEYLTYVAHPESVLGPPIDKGASGEAESAGERRRIPLATRDEQNAAFLKLLRNVAPVTTGSGTLWTVNLNREAKSAVWRSRLAVKADAASSLFNVRSDGVRWAVIDTGVDATHPAFKRRDALSATKDPPAAAEHPSAASRIVRTYDFLRLKQLLDPDSPVPEEYKHALKELDDNVRAEMEEDLRRSLLHGRAIDWDLLEPFLRVPHTEDYIKPEKDNKHGTHVAGILAGNWPAAENERMAQDFVGICPDLELYDVRALGPGADEFTVMAALQFVRYLNAHKDVMVIHGVNLSMAVPHDVTNFACGRTPICQECERVVASGVVVVVAAGNRGFKRTDSVDDGASGDYRYISITDPGNAESVITVGSTHRHMPHTYGVSYFSSRGPTGDGRTKPDLVAPGERIDGPTPDGEFDTLDGTSMAAPHVSGAAALLMSRHRELIGQPLRIKKILTSTATDLGREPRFQGSGMLDVLRAIQSI